MEFYFKQAQTKDIPLVFELFQQVFRPTYQKILSEQQMAWMMENIFSKASFFRQHDQETFRFILLYVAETLAGFAVTEDAHNQRPGICKMHKLYLHPDFQRKGLGRALIQEAMRQAGNSRQYFFVLNVNRYNNARRFYEQLGFEILETVDIPLEQGYFMNDYIMGINLRPASFENTD